MLVGMCGLISSGKDTAADFLVKKYNFKRESFAGTLKDIVALVFGWDRNLLEGLTAESRAWREQKDIWWSNRLGISITPRWVLQYWGTDVLRNNFHNDIWIASLEKKLANHSQNIVITDCRFPNEIDVLRKLNGKLCRIMRGSDPEWFEFAKYYMQGPTNHKYIEAKFYIQEHHIHPSEYSWADTKFDVVIDNNGTIENLYTQLDNFLK